MNKNRLSNLMVVVALAVMAALTISQVAATNRVVSAASGSGASVSIPPAEQCSAPDVDRSSIHSVYVKELGRWMTYTDQGPTGVDGGLIQLFSDSQSCSR